MPEKSQKAETAGAQLADGAFPAWPLPPGPTAPAFARSVARSVLAELGMPPAAVDDVQTIISELATNAVVHGDRYRAEVWAYLSRHPFPRLTLKVFDAAPWRGAGAAGPAGATALIAGEPASDACGGRGLMLVKALTEEAGGCWGVHPSRAVMGPVLSGAPPHRPSGRSAQIPRTCRRWWRISASVPGASPSATASIRSSCSRADGSSSPRSASRGTP